MVGWRRGQIESLLGVVEITHRGKERCANDTLSSGHHLEILQVTGKLDMTLLKLQSFPQGSEPANRFAQHTTF